MTAAAFDDWLARGRVHLGEGRPTDAIPCFRRAAREDPRSPVPHFHLGEVLWQLGLADDAVRAWQASADLDKTFSPPRLALAEVALTRGDFAVAADNARRRRASPGDARAHLTALRRARCGCATSRKRRPLRRATGCRSEPSARRAGRVGRARRRDSAGVATRAFTPQDVECAAPLALVTPRATPRSPRVSPRRTARSSRSQRPATVAAALARPHGGRAPAPRVADAGARSRELRRGRAGARGRRARAVFRRSPARAVRGDAERTRRRQAPMLPKCRCWRCPPKTIRALPRSSPHAIATSWSTRRA
jgi:hypothetical protein